MPVRPLRLQEVEAPRISIQSVHEVVRLSAIHAGHRYLHEIFLVLISIRGWVELRVTGR